MAQDSKTRFHELTGDNNAPEVAQPYDAPIPAPTMIDGLQSAYSTGKPAPYYAEQHARSPEQNKPSSEQNYSSPEPARRLRRWPWVLGIILAALIGLGAGIGIGYAVGDTGSGKHATRYVSLVLVRSVAVQ